MGKQFSKRYNQIAQLSPNDAKMLQSATICFNVGVEGSFEYRARLMEIPLQPA